MGRNIYKALVILSLGAIMVVYNNCGSPFGSPSPLYFESNIYGGSASVSYDAFEKTVYPITRANCVSCHQTQQPQHASADVKTAHDAIITGFKVNFTSISNSRMVKKLREDNHNCWGDCEDNAKEMEEAIAEWNEAIKDSGETPTDNTPVDTSKTLVGTKTLAEEMAIAGNTTRDNVVNLNVESAMLQAPMIKQTTAADGTYLTVPNSTNTTLSSTDINAGAAFFNFAIRRSSTQYRIWGLVNAPNTSDNGFYTNITSTNTGIKEWEIPVTNGWEWRQLPNNTFNLSVGNHTLQLRQRKDGTKIKQIVITSDNSFNGTTASDLMGITLTYDISEAVKVPGITFKVDVSEYDMYSYKFQNPRIITTSANIRARKVKLLVNDNYNPQHSTFTLIDKVATPQDAGLLTYAMVVIKDKGASGDKISFNFETLRVDTGGGANGGVDPNDLASVEAFRTNVWPISRNNCINCHTVQNPPHAHDDYVEAHDVVLTQNLVNFTTPASSRLVTKVQGRHNCGTQTQCNAIAQQYLNAIIEWKKSRP